MSPFGVNSRGSTRRERPKGPSPQGVLFRAGRLMGLAYGGRHAGRVWPLSLFYPRQSFRLFLVVVFDVFPRPALGGSSGCRLL